MKNKVKYKRINRVFVTGKYVGIALLIFLISLAAAICSSVLLSYVGFSDEKSSVIADVISGIIAVIAAVMVLVQLKQDDNERKRQNDIEEASFILQYNQSFIQDENMTAIESLLENNAYYGLKSPIINNGNRQRFINYLVYLEGLAPTILNGVLNLEHIDDLMAYRFFLAMNNPEIQESEIAPFAEYYRGCFALYQIWSEYRRKKHLGIPLAESSLDKLDVYRYMLIDISETNCIGKQLSSEDTLTNEQYTDIARLIYQTDPYIYPAMFTGDTDPMKAAEKLLPELIEKGIDKMFRKNNLYVLMASNVIIGVILWHKGGLTWNGDAFIQFAEDRGIGLNRDNIRAVAQEYFETQYAVHEQRSAPISLINVCVANYLRGKGIGKIMLERFIADHIKENMELAVLSDNKPAIALYHNCGFEIVSSYDGFSLEKEKPECYAMYRRV